MVIEFRPATGNELERLKLALTGNAVSGEAIRMNPRTTNFIGGDLDDAHTEEVIASIRSIPCHYSGERDVSIAVELLRTNEAYLDDARVGAPLGNSVVGSLLSIQHGIPRQNAEAAVLSAVQIIDSSRAESIESDKGGNFTLTRTGQSPIRFRGEKIAFVEGQWTGGKENNRWYDFTLYRTTSGKFVVHVEYTTRWQGELDRSTVEVCGTAVEVAEFLREHHAADAVKGFPEGEQYADRQAALLESVRERYESLVSEILAELPESAEVIE